MTTTIGCTYVTQIAVFTVSVFLAIYAQHAVFAEFIIVNATYATAFAVCSIVICTFRTHLMGFTIIHAIGAPSAQFTDRYISFALFTFAAVITA